MGGLRRQARDHATERPGDDAYIPFGKAIELGHGVLTRKKLEKAIKEGDPVKVRDRKPSQQRRDVHIQDVLQLIDKLTVDEGVVASRTDVKGRNTAGKENQSAGAIQ